MLWYSKAVLARRRGDPNTDGTRDREGEVEAAASEGIIWAAALSQPEDGGDIPQEGPTTEDMPGEVEGGGEGELIEYNELWTSIKLLFILSEKINCCLAW
jgi:hypothetical protein